MLERGKLDRGIVEIVDTESLVPKDHLLRKIDAAVDFNRLYEMVELLYSEDNGRPSVDPVVLFKMVLIQHLYGLPSLRRTAEEVSANICYRWFLGYTLQEETPHFSTVSYNFRYRFTEDTVNEIYPAPVILRWETTGAYGTSCRNSMMEKVRQSFSFILKKAGRSGQKLSARCSHSK